MSLNFEKCKSFFYAFSGKFSAKPDMISEEQQDKGTKIRVNLLTDIFHQSNSPEIFYVLEKKK